MADKMHYFRSVKGHAARRCGTETFIGCVRGPKGFTWNTDVVVAIPDLEMMPYRKDYASYVRHGDLMRATEADYKAWLDKRKAASEAVQAERKERIEAAKAEAEKKAPAAPAAPIKDNRTKAQKRADKKADAAAAANSTSDSEAEASDTTGNE